MTAYWGLKGVDAFVLVDLIPSQRRAHRAEVSLQNGVHLYEPGRVQNARREFRVRT